MAPIISFVTAAVCVCLLVNHSSSVYTDGCSASPLLPESPFVVVWNHPTSACEDKGVHLDFSRWGIVDNTRDRFFGQQIVLFYNLGKWPYYSNSNPVNGGLPQLSDLQAHLTKVDADLKTNVWNKTFGGLGIIDMEYWRPLYWTNFDSKSVYQRKSQALAKLRFPSYNKTQVLAEAIKEFNKAARDFMSQTLQKVSTKRPNGKWGFYLFPRCFDATCNTTTIRNNDRISWLFQESSALYPSIYFKLVTPKSSVSRKIKQTLHEAFRVKAKYSSQNIPVMPYTKSQEGPYKMYQKMDLSVALLQPANMGSSGVVIWGSSSEARAKNECLILQDYINNVLGPYSRNVTDFFGNCTQQLCNGHGRCVRKDYERIYQRHLREGGRSNCLLPSELLTEKKKFPDTSNTTYSGDIVSGGTFQKTNHKKRIRQNNMSFGFTNHKMNRFFSDFKLRKQTKPFDEDNVSIKSSKSVSHFSMKAIKYNIHDGTVPLELRDEDPDSSLNSNSNIKLDSNENSVPDPKPIPTFNTNAPFYDFDDYICKCYPGFSGNRCDNKHD